MWFLRKLIRGAPRETSKELQKDAANLGCRIDIAVDKLLNAIDQLRIEVDRIAKVRAREDEIRDSRDDWTIE